MRIVVDTNVLVSGIFFGGPPGRILHTWREGAVQFVLSSEILEEYQEVLGEVACSHAGVDLRALVGLLVLHAEMVVSPPLSEIVCTDPADDKFLACALAAGVNCIVSGDKHLLKMTGYRGIEVLKPRDFLERYLS